MSEKYNNKYRIESARLPNWNYGWNAAYFITICTQNREQFFGEMCHDKMKLSTAGAIANVLWYEIKNHSKHIRLGKFVVMPNYIHGILILNKPDDDGRIDGRNDGRIVKTLHATSLQFVHQPPPPSQQPIMKNQKMAAISPKSNSISTIIRSYRLAVTKHCNRLQISLSWQSRFHDHIIRNDESFYKISDYIKNNPINWKVDKFYQQ